MPTETQTPRRTMTKAVMAEMLAKIEAERARVVRECTQQIAFFELPTVKS